MNLTKSFTKCRKLVPSGEDAHYKAVQAISDGFVGIELDISTSKSSIRRAIVVPKRCKNITNYRGLSLRNGLLPPPQDLLCSAGVDSDVVDVRRRTQLGFAYKNESTGCIVTPEESIMPREQIDFRGMSQHKSQPGQQVVHEKLSSITAPARPDSGSSDSDYGIEYYDVNQNEDDKDTDYDDPSLDSQSIASTVLLIPRTNARQHRI